jgi:hypothetical protein
MILNIKVKARIDKNNSNNNSIKNDNSDFHSWLPVQRVSITSPILYAPEVFYLNIFP